MARELNIFERDEGWIDMGEGLISKTRLENWIEEYFGREEDLSIFKRRNNGDLELTSKKGDRGYVFVYEQQLDRDHEGRMKKEKEFSEYIGRNTLRVFVDNQEGLSGFYWEGPTII